MDFSILHKHGISSCKCFQFLHEHFPINANFQWPFELMWLLQLTFYGHGALREEVWCLTLTCPWRTLHEDILMMNSWGMVELILSFQRGNEVQTPRKWFPSLLKHFFNQNKTQDTEWLLQRRETRPWPTLIISSWRNDVGRTVGRHKGRKNYYITGKVTC